MTRHRSLTISLVVAIVAAGCGSTEASMTPAMPASSTGPSPTVAPTPTPMASPTATPVARVPSAIVDGVAYHPTIDPAAFSTSIDNPYLPLEPGTVLTYEGDGERIVVTVTGAERIVMGVTTRVVRDRAYEDDALVEDTEDWFAEDAAGNVWYFGEATAECEDGTPVSRHGAWEAGVDGAQPGVVMLAEPRVGDHYRQESYPGQAEDEARVLHLDATVDGPTGRYQDVLVTEDVTPLEPDLVEHKSYAAGVGVVQEETIRGGSGIVRLVEIRHDPAAISAPPDFDPCGE